MRKEVLALIPDKRIQINAAATVFFKNRHGETEMHPAGFLVPKQEEVELKQFAIEFKQFPLPEKYVKRSLEDLCKAVLESMREKGLVRD